MIRAVAFLLGTALMSAAGAELAASATPGESAPIELARAHLLNRLREARPDVERFELTLIGHLPSLSHAVVSADAFHGSALSARTCVWLKASGASGSLPVWFSVKAYRKVLVSQRNYVARDPVDAGDFVVEERDVAALSRVPLSVDADLGRMRARHLISAGRTVMQEDLEDVPQVLRGQEVTVEVKHGAVKIETSAVALREARFGEPVTLQNPTSHMTYAARVVGQGRAAVIQ